MLNAEEARAIAEKKMERFISWSVLAMSEDENYYYCFFGVKEEACFDPHLPVVRVNKANGKIKPLWIMEGDNFRTLCAARVFYNYMEGDHYTVEERAAIRQKFQHHSREVHCPRCGGVLVYMRIAVSEIVTCQHMCIKCGVRKW